MEIMSLYKNININLYSYYNNLNAPSNVTFKVKKVIIAITVRTLSKRLKKKLLKIGKKNIIEWCIYNCKKSNIKNKSIILTTTCKKEDLQFKKVADKENISFFKGSEKNVVNRLLRLLVTKKGGLFNKSYR